MFHGRYLRSWNSVGIIRYHRRRRWKRLAESVPKTYRPAQATSLCVEQSSFENRPSAVCDVHRRVR